MIGSRLYAHFPSTRWALFLVLFAILAVSSTAAAPAGADNSGDPPARPTGMRISVEQGSLDVSVAWEEVDGAGEYWVRWRLVQPDTKLNEGVKVQSSSAAITLDDFGLWEFHLAACNEGGCGDPAVRTAAVGPVARAQRQQSTATADAGSDQEVLTGATVTLDGSGSSSTTSGATLTYAWTQSSGVTVTLDDTTAQMPSFTAPSVRTDLVFSLVVNDGTNSSGADTVSVAVRPPLNPTEAPCAHPVDMIDNALNVNSIEISNITSSAFSIRGTDTTAEHDFHFCRPDGTRETLATGQRSTDTTTKTGLASGTRYWWAAKAARSGNPDNWTEWVEVITTGGASVIAARFTSSPASGDTFGIGETIQAQVTWSRPVTVANGGHDRNVSLWLDLGADDSNLADSRRKMTWTGEGSGTDTLTFEYTVGFGGTDMDTDGVWLQTASATDNTVVFLESGATITGGNPASNTAVRTRADMPTTGDAGRKVDDTTTATADAGSDQEVQTGATVTLDASGSSSSINGATLTYAWTQTSGATVTLDDTTAQMPSFTAPSVRRDLEFALVVNDGTNPSRADRVSVAVRPPLNPTEAPCVHPVDAIDNALNLALIEITNITSSAFSIRGTDTTAEHDFHFCRPDGTRETLATGQMSTDTTTKTGLASATRYWWAAKAARSGNPDNWTEWVEVITTGGASVLAARFTSSPASGVTFGIGETIQAQVTWSQPVTVANGGDNRNVWLWLDLGADDIFLANSRRKMAWTGEGSGTDTLTFEYTVGFGGIDMDSDGVWLQPASDFDHTVVFLASGATITGGNPASNTAFRTRANMPTKGDAGRKVDDTTTATADAGTDQEVQTGATVTLDGSGSSSTISGATLTYAWTQTSGATVTLDNTTTQMPSFTAPSVPAALEFALVVNDGTNASRADTVSVAVRPPLNPSSAPCVHPSGGTEFKHHRTWVVTRNINNGSFELSGRTSQFTYDFHLCEPDGTSETKHTGVAEDAWVTISGLASATRYWLAAKAVRSDIGTQWTDWIEVTTTGGARVLEARFTSSPASGNTFRIGETIQAQVTWSRPVTVANGGANRNVSLRLDLGDDDSNLADSRRKMTWTGEGSGTDTLTFEYTVGFGGMDTDDDGVWLQPASATNDIVVFLENGATITGGNPATNTALRNLADLPTAGDTGRQVDDTSTATADAGPDQEALTGATVTLDGRGTSTLENPTFTYAWTQTSGANVTLDDSTAQMPSFTAPSLPADLVFTLVVNDGTNPSTGDTISVAVRPPFNPTSAPCAHPSGGSYTANNKTVTGILTTNSTIKFRSSGAGVGGHNDLWFCRPDGTSHKRAENVNHHHVHTESGLDSGTRYWVLVKWWTGASNEWSDWVEAITTGGASIRGARFTSSPAYDADRDGRRDTYLSGETIQAQVTWSQTVTVANGGADANVSLRLDLGTDDSNLSNSRRKMAWTGEGSGTDTLTFEYTVNRHDADADGVWLQPASATNDIVVFLENGATITGGNPASNTAVRNLAGLSTTGDAGRRVGLTSQKLVGKSSQTFGVFTGSFLGDYGQQFTTGDDGYKLTSVAIRMSSTATSAPVYTVSFHEDSGSDTSSRPGSRLALLEKPAGALGAEGLYSFTVPGEGIDLRADTKYWVVIDVSTGTDKSLVHATSSSFHDTGSLEGWSIKSGAAGRVSRLKDDTEWKDTIGSVRMDLHGYVKPKVAIELVRFVSAPTYDSDADGVNDTYVLGDKVLVDVDFREPVVVPGTGPQLKLNLGTDGSGTSKTMDMESVLHGGMTVRFSYTVTASDSDTDGLFVETLGSGQLFFGPGGATAVKSVETGGSVNRYKTGLPDMGDPFTKADGSKTSSDRGPVPTGATVNGAALTVTYDRSLNTSVDTAKLAPYFSVRGAGSVGAGNRNGFQHPTVNSVTGDSNEKLQMTLGDPAQAGDTVWLTYKLESHVGLLKGAGATGKMAPAFVDLAVTNNTPGTAGPKPWHATVKGTELTLVFDGTLDGDSAPAGSAFEVWTDDLDDDTRTISGTGTATVSGAKVTVSLAKAVRANETARVYYTKPASNPLQDADGNDVLSFDSFRVERVYDAISPTYRAGAAVQTVATSGSETSKVALYFDETLDEFSVPITGNFLVTVGTNSAVNPNSVAIVDNAVVLTLNSAIASGTTVKVSYTRGTKPILDLADNAVPTFPTAKVLTATGTGKPELQTVSVAGARLSLTYDKPLNPGKEPAPDRFTLNYPLASDETNDDVVKYVSVVAVSVEGKSAVLQLEHPVYPCAGAIPFTVTYKKIEASTPPHLQNFDGSEAIGYSNETATNARASWCVNGNVEVPANGNPQGFTRSSARARSLTMKFDRSLDTGRALSAEAFRLAGASGEGAPAVESAAYTADGAGVTLTLGRALAAGETVTLGYTRPAGESGLWDSEGKQIADFSGVPVPKTLGVTGVEVVSDAGDDATYGLGETIRVRLSFSEAVEVEGSPRLKIDMDPAHWGQKWAVYESGSGTADLVFVHEVVQPNFSTQGIAVLGNTLELNGGAIRSAATEADANLAHEGLVHDPAHKVDWRANSPATGAPTITGTAQVGETLTADTTGISDADGLDSATFSYQWLADDTDISGATGNSYTLAAADAGKAVKVRVSFTDDAGHAETLTSAATAAVAAALPPPAPTNLVVSDNGNGTLTLTWDAPDDDSVTGYQILRRRPNEGEKTLLVYVADTGSTDTTWTDEDVTIGTRHVYRVKAINAAGLSGASNFDRVTPASPPENIAATGAPTITGTARVGETLTAGTSDISDADGLDSATFSYQWLADDADISGATNLTYTLVEADEGKAIKVRVYFTDDAGHAETLTSAATAAVAAATPPAVSSIKVDGATVTVTFDEDLAPVSSVDTLHLYWTISGTAVDQHPNRASVSGRTVTLEIGTPAVAGQTITVSYESSGHLKDADGNAVESFSVTATNLTR